MQPVKAIPAADLRPQLRADAMPEMVISAQEYEERFNKLRQFVKQQMIESVDYGCIPNTPKPTLFRPGAEKLLAIHGFSTRYETIHRVEAFCDKVPFCLYEVKVLVMCKRSGQLIAEGLGACNARERKYAKQDPANVANTVLKMAKKRALIDATLLATRTSGLFSSGDTKETSFSAPKQEVAPEPALVLVASRAELDRAERIRARAVQLGYLTDSGTVPKPVAEGESRRNVGAKAEKWRLFIVEEERRRAEEIATPETDTFNASSPQEGKGPRYTIPTHARPTNCTSCGAEIFWTLTAEKKKVPVNSDGYSHFTTCPNANEHSHKNKGGNPVKPGLPKHIKHLWAVADAAGLDTTKATRDERLINANKVLLDHEFDAVESWNDLSPEAARCLAGAIDAKILTWGAANTTQGDEAA
jgi:hypothetical protein